MNESAVTNGASILLVKTSSMGDIIHTYPVVRALKNSGAERVDWVVNSQYKELVRLSPHVDKVIGFDRNQVGDFWRSRGSMSALRGFIHRIRERKYDIAIDLQGLLRSAIITRLASTNRTIGFAHAREGSRFFYQTTVETRPNSHAVTKNLRILTALGIDTDDSHCDLKTGEEAAAKATELTGTEPYMVINPNARWKSKQWSLDRFAQVAASVEKTHKLRTVIIGAPDETVRGANLAALIGTSSKTLDLTGKSDFSTLAGILEGATAIVTNDSGPMHLAAALGKRVVALYGPTDPRTVGPCGEGHKVISTNFDCAPCRKRSCRITPSCLEAIDIERVTNAIDQQLFTEGSS